MISSVLWSGISYTRPHSALKKPFKPFTIATYLMLLAMVIGLSGIQFRSACNHTSDNKIGRPRIGSPICLSRVWLQTELDDTKAYYQLIIKVTISEKKKTSQVMKNRGKFAVKYWQRRRKHSKGYHFEITGYPCNVIGSQRCDLFTNRTIFCSKSHPFLSQYEWDNKTKQPIRF